MTAKIKILLVSADPAMQGFLPRQLGEAGYQVITVQDNEEQIRAVLDEDKPDFVIQDIMMPGMDGIELSLRMRQWSQVPVLMLSAWGAEENMVRGLDLSAETYLTEPFGIDDVMRAIETACQRNMANANLISYARSGSL